MVMSRQSFIPKVIPTLVLWSDSIYAITNLEKLAFREPDAKVKRYLVCLIELKRIFHANYPNLENLQKTLELAQLLNQLSELALTLQKNDDTEFLAAIYNLLGLAQLWVKQYEVAIKHFNLGYFIAKEQIAKAVLMSHLACSQEFQNGNSMLALKNHDTACLMVNGMFADQVPHERAAIYFQYAKAASRIYRQTGAESHFKEANRRYGWALRMWKNCNVITNNRAIMFSKRNCLEGLDEAADWLDPLYERAQDNSQFVVAYYRADIALKVAAYVKVDDGMKAEHRESDFASQIADADAFLQAAKKAIMARKNLASNLVLTDYENKALARINKLETNLNYLLGLKMLAQSAKDKAIEYRNKVKEPLAKKQKFIDGLVNLDSPFKTVDVFFRRPRECQEDHEADLVHDERRYICRTA